jgi:hypothetical protein
MKSATSIRLVLTLALAVAALGWLPEQKTKRKMRMADAAPATQLFESATQAPA